MTLFCSRQNLRLNKYCVLALVFLILSGCAVQRPTYRATQAPKPVVCDSYIWSWNELNTCRADAEAGSASAAVSLAKIYEKGESLGIGSIISSEKRRVGKDVREAFRWWVRAADLGDKLALRKVVDEYRSGYKIPKNITLSEKYIELAASKGIEWALLIKAGRLEDSDPADSGDIYLRLARKDNCFAQKRLSVAYLEGDIVKRNPTQAYFWALLSNIDGFSRKSEFHPLVSEKVNGEYPVRKNGILSFSRSIRDNCYIYSSSSVKYLLEKKLPLIYREQAQNAATGWQVGKIEAVLESPPQSVVVAVLAVEKDRNKKQSKELALLSSPLTVRSSV